MSKNECKKPKKSKLPLKLGQGLHFSYGRLPYDTFLVAGSRTNLEEKYIQYGQKIDTVRLQTFLFSAGSYTQLTRWLRAHDEKET